MPDQEAAASGPSMPRQNLRNILLLHGILRAEPLARSAQIPKLKSPEAHRGRVTQPRPAIVIANNARERLLA